MKIFGYEITVRIEKSKDASVNWIKAEVEKYLSRNPYGTLKINRIKALRQEHVSKYIIKNNLISVDDMSGDCVGLKWAKEWVENNYQDNGHGGLK
ncbi:MAG: hypothetical protein WC677_07580 [Clostridia bacterium]|jgi:hypothetical protein